MDDREIPLHDYDSNSGTEGGHWKPDTDLDKSFPLPPPDERGGNAGKIQNDQKGGLGGSSKPSPDLGNHERGWD